MEILEEIGGVHNMLKTEDMQLLAQLLHTMKDVAAKVEQYHAKKNSEKLHAAKQELLGLQKRVDELLR